MPQPIEHCYWVVPGRFLAGEYPRTHEEVASEEKINALIEAGVTAFVDLTRTDDNLRPYAPLLAGVSYQRFPIRDVSVPDSEELTTAILDAIDHHIDQGGTVYLHCWGGVGRTGLIVGCWLARHGEKGGAAYDRLQQLWKNCPKSGWCKAPETEEQKKYVLNWKEPQITLLKRYQGCLTGLAVGDAVGTTVEFKVPGTFPPVEEMVGGGPFGLQPGEWTDDTSMALCLAESLIACNGFDAHDLIRRYVRWWREGYLSSNGHCFDIGSTVIQALQRYQRTGDPFAGSTEANTASDGSLMRLAPVALFFASEPERAILLSGESSRTSHGARTCLDACRYFAGLLVGAVQGAGKEELLSSGYAPVPGGWEQLPLCEEIDEIARGSFKQKDPPAIVGSGYVVQSLEAALWAFHRSSSFKEGCLLAVNLGNDADTTAAIYGQIAGAYYGIDSIPATWRERLVRRDLIDGLGNGLYQSRVHCG